MTPQEKAFEIIENYFTLVARYDFDTNDKYDEPYQEIAEICALIQVVEMIEFEKRIIKEVQFLSDAAGRAFKCEGLYWESVKNEIEKICNSK
jgi:hypothetical protein